MERLANANADVPAMAAAGVNEVLYAEGPAQCPTLGAPLRVSEQVAAGSLPLLSECSESSGGPRAWDEGCTGSTAPEAH